MEKKKKFDFRDTANLEKVFAAMKALKAYNCRVNLGRLPGYAVVIAMAAVYLFWYDGDKIRRRIILKSNFNGPGHHDFENIRIDRKRQRVVVDISTQHTKIDGSSIRPIDRPYIVTVSVPMELLKKK